MTDQPDSVCVELPAVGSDAYAYGEKSARVREVLDRLEDEVRKRLVGAGFRNPNSEGGDRGKVRSLWLEKESPRPSELVEEINRALEGISFPAGCFIVTGKKRQRVGDMDEWNRERYLKQGATEDTVVPHWTEISRVPLSKRRLP